jgi:hypothetical protein
MALREATKEEAQAAVAQPWSEANNGKFDAAMTAEYQEISPVNGKFIASKR